MKPLRMEALKSTEYFEMDYSGNLLQVSRDPDFYFMCSCLQNLLPVFAGSSENDTKISLVCFSVLEFLWRFSGRFLFATKTRKH